MAINLIQTSKKLMQAINFTTDRQLCFNTKQIIGKDGRKISLYIISEAVVNPDTGKIVYNELYSSSSMVRIVMYLRDGWCLVSGQPLPTDQEKWNSVREELRENGKYWT